MVFRIKERLRTISNLDDVKMPFRVNFTRIGASGLEVDVLCYFAAVKGDEFLKLQQVNYHIKFVVELLLNVCFLHAVGKY